MRKLFLFILPLLLSVTAFGTNENPEKREMRSTIVKLLGKTNFTIEEELSTTVVFVINKKSEIVIVDIQCSNTEICSFIKQKLNYKKVNVKQLKEIEVYKVPLRFSRNHKN
ncbi:hypothetical protein [Tenacibaculum sp. SG-28]|uniref:hypothetical protein n=1 Tax=Tenacibaculum sp. SG-28 TaxID=754426 RepID=UPI000CF3C954|nr:hypothetical protein [Tenacibaculum sp. SG-28]PQJ21697.1 hypothetical protein BSU00_06335 [Tenacibaculum sp. SG-28]